MFKCGAMTRQASDKNGLTKLNAAYADKGAEAFTFTCIRNTASCIRPPGFGAQTTLVWFPTWTPANICTSAWQQHRASVQEFCFVPIPVMAAGGTRKRQRRAEEEPATDPQQQAAQENDRGGETASGPSQPGVDRRAGFAEIARRRAAHFAHFNEEGQEEDAGPGGLPNVHAGGNEARTLGPWSSAVELVNERERAAERRRAKLQDASLLMPDDGSLSKASWTPRRDHTLGPRVPCPVDPLHRKCLHVLVQYIDCVESLYGVPDTMRTLLAEMVCERRAMTPQVAELFACDATTELVLPDCCQLDREAMVKLLTHVVTPRLERLELGKCGRGFGDNTLKRLSATPASAPPPEEASEALVRAAQQCPGGQLPRLTRLLLDGAYRLDDEGLIQVLRVMPSLQHLAVPDASRLTPALLPSLASLCPQLRHLDISNCRGLDAASLSQYIPRLKYLSTLHLSGITEVDDTVLAAVADSCAQLTHLHINMCTAVTDAGITALAARCPGLQSLSCDLCAKVTDKGLQAVAANCHGLKCLSALRVARITDVGLLPVIARGTLERLSLHGATGVTDASVLQLAAHCHATLSHLDVSFCRCISSEALGELVDRCAHLTSLLVYGCSQLNNKFAHGHTNEGLLQAGGPCGLGTAVTLAAA